jgi:ammonia channel protein AmtB
MGEGFEAAALARTGQAGEQRVGILQGLVEISPATHPVEVAAGMLFGLLAAGCCEAEDALPHQLSFAGTPAAVAAPAAGGINGDHAGTHRHEAPIGEFLNVMADQLAGVDAIAEGHGVEALAGAAHINAHHRDRGSGGQGMFLHGTAAA